MYDFFGALFFAALMLAHVLAVIFISHARDESAPTSANAANRKQSNTWLFGWSIPRTRSRG